MDEGEIMKLNFIKVNPKVGRQAIYCNTDARTMRFPENLILNITAITTLHQQNLQSFHTP